MKKHQRETVAAIDVGSNFLRMMIAEISAAGRIDPLEDVWKPTQIGRDTFASGQIEIPSIQELCHTLKGFKQLMKDYGVKHYHAVGTSGIREAHNREYVLDQVLVRTGIKVEIINNAEERFYEYKALRDVLPYIPQKRQEGIMVVSIGMGGVEISTYAEGKLQVSEYVKVGSLRLREILADLERLTLDFPKVIEEFVESKVYLLDALNSHTRIKNLIGLGGELSLILKLCQLHHLTREESFIHRDVLEKIVRILHGLTTEQIISNYQLHRNEAEIIVPSAVIFRRFLRATQAEGIHVPKVSLRHGLLANMVDERFETQRKTDFLNDMISSARYLGRKFRYDEDHANQVEDISISIFEQSKRIHKLGDKEKLYLRLAAILHDIGKFINSNEHDLLSCNIIQYQEILGLSDRDLDLIATIARYHSEENPHGWHENYRSLDAADRIVVSKLAAILKLADALDISHKKRVESVEINTSGTDICFYIQAHGDILLESWDFANQAGFYEEVFGYKPILKRRG